MSMRSSWAVVLLLAACTFPEIEIVGQGGGADTSSSSAAAQTGGGTGATTTTSSGSSTGTGAVECDDDMDGAMIEHPDCCTVTAECDCNDDNGDVFPGQEMFFTVKRPDKAPDAIDAFDYDCSGVNEEEWPQGDCTTLGACATGSMLHVFQPVGTYECGADGRHRFCNGLTCEQPTVKLGCR